MLQTKERSLHRPIKCTPQTYRRRLYQLGKHADELNLGVAAAEPAGDSDQADSDDDQAQARQAKALRLYEAT